MGSNMGPAPQAEGHCLSLVSGGASPSPRPHVVTHSQRENCTLCVCFNLSIKPARKVPTALLCQPSPTRRHGAGSRPGSQAPGTGRRSPGLGFLPAAGGPGEPAGRGREGERTRRDRVSTWSPGCQVAHAGPVRPGPAPAEDAIGICAGRPPDARGDLSHD